MNVIKFNTNKAKGLFVEVPSVYIFTKYKISGTNYLCLYDNGWFTDETFKLPDGNYQILNLSNQLSEEQMEMVCEDYIFYSNPDESQGGVRYKNYSGKYPSTVVLDDSYASLKKSLNVIDENPIPELQIKEYIGEDGKIVLAYDPVESVEWENYQKFVKSYIVLLEVK